MISKRRWFKAGGLVLGLFSIVIIFPLCFPKALFAHSVVHNRLSVYSDRPIPEELGKVFLQQIEDRLNASPLQSDDKEMQVFVANNELLRKWLWLVVPSNAGGFVLKPLTRRHTFFSGADFEANTLIGPSGYRPAPPRDLAYYGAHELTHVATGEKVGWLRLHLMPRWVREGLADYVAMPLESAKSLYAKIGEQNADLDMMNEYGVYAPFRLLVTYFLEEQNWTVDQLLASNLSLREARSIAFQKLRD